MAAAYEVSAAPGQGVHADVRQIDKLVDLCKDIWSKGSGLPVRYMKMAHTNLLLQNS